MIIPPQNMEVEQIYADIWTSHYRSVAITSANSQEGVTTLAVALTQRNLLAGHSTLLVDLNLYHPSFKSTQTLENKKGSELLQLPQLVSGDEDNISLMGVVAPQDRASIMQLRKPGVLENCLEEWHENYDTVIIDALPVNRVNGNNIPAERIAAACDATVMVVRAGHTREAMVSKAIGKLNRAKAHLAGCVINDRDNPSLKAELIREARRIEGVLPRLSKKLQEWLMDSPLMSIDD